MKFETLINLLLTIVFGALGITAFLGVLIKGATWHIPTAIICLIVAYVCYTDDSYGAISVQQFLYNKLIKSR